MSLQWFTKHWRCSQTPARALIIVECTANSILINDRSPADRNVTTLNRRTETSTEVAWVVRYFER